MKQDDLAQSLARQTHLSRAAARDQVDEVVHRILEKLRQGRPVDLPGVGKLAPKAPARPRTR